MTATQFICLRMCILSAANSAIFYIRILIVLISLFLVSCTIHASPNVERIGSSLEESSIDIFIDHAPFKMPEDLDNQQFRPFEYLIKNNQTSKTNTRYWLKISSIFELNLSQERGYLYFGDFERILIYQLKNGSIENRINMGHLYKKSIKNVSPHYNLLPIDILDPQEALFVQLSSGFHINDAKENINPHFIPIDNLRDFRFRSSFDKSKGIVHLGLSFYLLFIILLCVSFSIIFSTTKLISFTLVCCSFLIFSLRHLEGQFMTILFWNHFNEGVLKYEILCRVAIFASFAVFALSNFKLGRYKRRLWISSISAIIYGIFSGVCYALTVSPFTHFSSFMKIICSLEILLTLLNSVAILITIWRNDNSKFAKVFVVSTLLYVIISYCGLWLNTTWLGQLNNFYSSKMYSSYSIFIYLGALATFAIKDLKNREDYYQEERMENKRLNSLQQYQTKLYTDISHELRTPLTIISGLANQLEDGKQKQLIQNNSKSLLQLINQILDISRIESGAAQLNEQDVELVSYMKVIVDSYSSLANEKCISLNFYSEHDTIPLLIDKDKLKTIVGNIISNAINYTPQYGKILVLLKTTQSEFVIKIKDTGVGISKENIDSIFDRFYRVRKPSTPSTGIGLSIVKELVHLLNGTIFVKSQLDIGTTFSLNFPLQETNLATHKSDNSNSNLHQKEIAPELGSIIDKSKATILLIEDNRDLIEYISNVLTPRYTLIKSNRAQAGIELAIKHIPDLIISDIMMPGKNGYELCAEIKNEIITSHIPVILLTAKADRSSKLKGLKTGAAAYLTKPFDEDELLIRIATILNNVKKSQEYFTQNSNSPLTLNQTKTVDPFITKVYEIIDSHISNENFGIPILCRELHLERTQVFRKIKAITGESASLLIKKKRMEKAHALLKENHRSISDIAFACGYSDPNYFSKVYKSYYNVLPSNHVVN